MEEGEAVEDGFSFGRGGKLKPKNILLKTKQNTNKQTKTKTLKNMLKNEMLFRFFFLINLTQGSKEGNLEFMVSWFN